MRRPSSGLCLCWGRGSCLGCCWQALSKRCPTTKPVKVLSCPSLGRDSQRIFCLLGGSHQHGSSVAVGAIVRVDYLFCLGARAWLSILAVGFFAPDERRSRTSPVFLTVVRESWGSSGKPVSPRWVLRPGRAKGTCLQSRMGACALVLVVNIPLHSESLWDWEYWACSWGRRGLMGPLSPAVMVAPSALCPFPSS